MTDFSKLKPDVKLASYEAVDHSRTKCFNSNEERDLAKWQPALMADNSQAKESVSVAG